MIRLLVLLLIALGLLTAMVIVFLFRTPAPTGATVEAFIHAHRLGADADTRRVIQRYLGRTRDFARRGMFLGLLSAMVLGIAWYQRISVGFGPSPLGDLVTMGLGGWFIGLLLSARYWRTPTNDGPRTARLTPRDADAYRSPRLARAMVAVAALSGVLGLAALLPGANTDRVAVAALALLTVGAEVWAARTQLRIAHRPQPFVTAELLAADQALRVTSARVIGLAAIGIGLVVIGWQAVFVVRGLATGTEVAWMALLPAAPLVAGLLVAGRARRLLRPKSVLAPAPLAV